MCIVLCLSTFPPLFVFLQKKEGEEYVDNDDDRQHHDVDDEVGRNKRGGGGGDGRLFLVPYFLVYLWRLYASIELPPSWLIMTSAT